MWLMLKRSKQKYGGEQKALIETRTKNKQGSSIYIYICICIYFLVCVSSALLASLQREQPPIHSLTHSLTAVFHMLRLFVEHYSYLLTYYLYHYITNSSHPIPINTFTTHSSFVFSTTHLASVANLLLSIHPQWASSTRPISTSRPPSMPLPQTLTSPTLLLPVCPYSFIFAISG